MAATVSNAWGKPGSWALDSELNEDQLNHQFDTLQPPPPSDFPSLSAAATTKPKKKGKGQTLSLAEFSNYSKPEPQRLTQDELLMLPTAPRQRTSDELDRTRLGGGFRNYGDSNPNSRARVSDRNTNNRDRDLAPSRADEVDDWSKTKKFGSNDRRDNNNNNNNNNNNKVGFFNSSRADEVDNWASSKSFGSNPSSEGARRERRMGFESYSNGSGSDSDNWLRKKDVRAVENGNGDGLRRPRLNLQPRTLPVVNNGSGSGSGSTPTDGGKAKGANPFGEARPREEVLAEKGKDWKELDEKLEALKVNGGEKSESFGRRRGFGMGRADSDADKSWRKSDSNDVVPSATPSSVKDTEEKVEMTEDISDGDKGPGEN